jgi:hypothetical protein
VYLNTTEIKKISASCPFILHYNTYHIKINWSPKRGIWKFECGAKGFVVWKIIRNMAVIREKATELRVMRSTIFRSWLPENSTMIPNTTSLHKGGGVGGLGWRSRCSKSLRVKGSGDRIPAKVRFSVPVLTGPGAHLASYTMGTGSPGMKRPGRGVGRPPPSRAIPLLPLWTFMAWSRVNSTDLVGFGASGVGLWRWVDV